MKFTLSILISILAMSAEAQLVTVPKSMEKIKHNLENSQKNKQAYDKSLIYILANIDEVQKAETGNIQQRNQLGKDLDNNRDILKKLAKQEKELQNLISKESEKLQTENKQVEQLESLLQQIKSNQAQRQQIIENYQKQLNSLKISLNSWTEREKAVASISGGIEKSVKSLQSQKETWIQQKNKHQKEAASWASETGKQQGILDTYTQLIKN